MSDELQIQQGSSTTPYALTGGAIGALGGGFGAHYLTKPKYGSYDDIIKEAKDSADFSSKIEKAEGEEKQFLEAAKDLAGKRAAAEAEYDSLYEAWKKEHPNTTKVETDEYKALKAAQTKAEEELEAKKKSLIDAEYEKIKNRASKSSLSGTFDAAELPTLINEATDKRQRDFYAKLEVFSNRKKALLDKVDEAKANGNKELEKQINGEIKALETQIKEELNTEISSWYKNPTAKAAKRSIKTSVDRAINLVDIEVDRRLFENAVDNELNTLDKQLISKLKTNGGGETFNAVVDQKKGNLDELTKAVDRKITFNRKQQNILRTVQYNYEKMLREAGTSATEAEQIRKQFEILWGLISKTETVTPAKELPKEFKQFVEGLKKEEKAAVERMLKDGEFTPENLKKAIEQMETETRALTEVRTTDIPNFRSRIEAKGGEGASFVDGVLLDKKGRKVNPRTGATFEYGTIVRDATGERIVGGHRVPPQVDIPRVSAADVKKSFETGEVKALTDEEIRKQAEEAVKASAYQKETNAVTEAKKAAEEAYAKLADGKALTAEEQEAAFLKDKGIESKVKYADSKVEAATNSFKSDFKKWLERKWGFAEHTNLKLAGAAVVGAAVIGGIAAAFAPKNNG